MDFSRISLADQCRLLGIAMETIMLPKTEIGWLVNDTAFKKPEAAAYENFRLQDYLGTYCEGSAVLMLMKCACLDYLAEINFFKSRDDACLRYMEAQCHIASDKSDRILAEILAANAQSIRANFMEIRSKPSYLAGYPEMDADALLAVWQSLSRPQWTQIVRTFLMDPYKYRAGWPDLMVTRGQEIRFVEVKTTDKLHASQKAVIEDVLLPASFSVSVLQLKPSKKP